MKKKNLLLLLACFAIPFCVGGASAWLWTQGVTDRPHGALASNKEIEEAEKSIDAQALQDFFLRGTVCGGLGLASGAAIGFLRSKAKKTQG